jgi:hypothetical protein
VKETLAIARFFWKNNLFVFQVLVFFFFGVTPFPQFGKLFMPARPGVLIPSLPFFQNVLVSQLPTVGFLESSSCQAGPYALIPTVGLPNYQQRALGDLFKI